MKDSLKYPRIDVRVGEWQKPLETEANRLGIKRGQVVRRAIQLYFSSGSRLEKLAQAQADLERLRRDLYRVGSNLNQIAAELNAKDNLDENRLAATHQELRVEFKSLMKLLQVIADDS